MKYKYCWLFFFVFYIVFVGCHKNIEIQETSDTTNKDEIENILLELKTRYLLVRTLKTGINVKFKVKNETQEIREHLVYKYPDKLKIVAFGALNEHKAVAIANEGEFILYFFQENEAIIAPLTDKVLSKIFDIDIRISDIRSALFSNPFLDSNTQNISCKKSGDKYIFQMPSSREDNTEEIVILMEGESPIVKEWKIIDKEKQIIQEVNFSDYREVGGIIRPFKVSIKRIPEKTEIVFNLVKPKINDEIKDSYFKIDLPESAKIRGTTRICGVSKSGE